MILTQDFFWFFCSKRVLFCTSINSIGFFENSLNILYFWAVGRNRKWFEVLLAKYQHFYGAFAKNASESFFRPICIGKWRATTFLGEDARRNARVGCVLLQITCGFVPRPRSILYSRNFASFGHRFDTGKKCTVLFIHVWRWCTLQTRLLIYCYSSVVTPTHSARQSWWRDYRNAPIPYQIA